MLRVIKSYTQDIIFLIYIIIMLSQKRKFQPRHQSNKSILWYMNVPILYNILF